MEIKGRDLVRGRAEDARDHVGRGARGAGGAGERDRRGGEDDARAHAARSSSADIVDRGIVLAGGGALLKNLDTLLREETGLPVFLAEDPLSAVVVGVGRCLDGPLLKDVSIQS